MQHGIRYGSLHEAVLSALFLLFLPAISQATAVSPYWDYCIVESGVITRTLTITNSETSPITISDPEIFNYGPGYPQEVEILSWSTSPIPPGGTGQVVFSWSVDEPQLMIGGLVFHSQGNLFGLPFFLGGIVDDGSERYEIAAEAYGVYQLNTMGSTAWHSNRGVINLCLGCNRDDYFGNTLITAYHRGNDSRTEFAAFAMNLGVYYCLPGRISSPGAAIASFETALEHADEAADGSVLTPRLYYNQARRGYLQDDDLDVAIELVNLASVHATTSERLRLKCLALRGAINIKRGDLDAALIDLQSVLADDPDGPIGRIASGYLDLWNIAEFEASIFQNPVLHDQMDLVVVRIRGASHFGAATIVGETATQLELAEISTDVFRSSIDLDDVTDASVMVAFRASSGRDTSVVKMFSAAGISSDEGGELSQGPFTLVLPTGCLPGDDIVTLIKTDAISPVASRSHAPVMASVLIGPSGTRLDKPANISVSVPPPADGLTYHLLKRGDESAPAVPAAFDSSTGRATADITSFGTYDLVISESRDISTGLLSSFFFGPNPMRSSANIEFALSRSTPLEIAIYDIAGRHVKTIAHGPFGDGRYTYNWNGCDDRERPVAAGVYFCRFTSPTVVKTTRILMMK